MTRLVAKAAPLLVSTAVFAVALMPGPARATDPVALIHDRALTSGSSSPSPRDDMGMTYDAARGQTVLFGGADDSGDLLGDTWTWNGATWTREQPATSPSARYGMGMAFDAALGDVVLFGGSASGHCCTQADTWTWDGANWTEQHPATSPPGRGAFGMTYDI